MYVFALRHQAEAVGGRRREVLAEQSGVRLQAVVEALRQDELIPVGIRIVADSAFHAGDIGFDLLAADQDIIDRHQALNARLDHEQLAVLGTVVNQGVIDEIEFDVGALVALGAEGNEGWVVGLRTLRDEIADDIGDTAIGKLEFVAGRALDLVAQAVVEDVVFLGPALEQMADAAMMEIAAAHAQTGDLADVEIMGAPVVDAVVGELRILDIEEHIGAARRQDAVLIVLELALAHGQVAFFEAYAGAVAVAYARIAEFEVLDRDGAAAHHPDALAFGVRAVRDQARPLRSDATYGEIGLLPDGDIGAVVAGLDFDGVAVGGQPGRCGNAAQRLLRPDAQRLAAARDGLTCCRHGLLDV